MSYLEEIVLPSVNLPVKPSYNLKEACQILCTNYRGLQRLTKRGHIQVTANHRIYLHELKLFFKRKPDSYAPQQ